MRGQFPIFMLLLSPFAACQPIPSRMEVVSRDAEYFDLGVESDASGSGDGAIGLDSEVSDAGMVADDLGLDQGQSVDSGAVPIVDLSVADVEEPMDAGAEDVYVAPDVSMPQSILDEMVTELVLVSPQFRANPASVNRFCEFENQPNQLTITHVGNADEFPRGYFVDAIPGKRVGVNLVYGGIETACRFIAFSEADSIAWQVTCDDPQDFESMRFWGEYESLDNELGETIAEKLRYYFTGEWLVSSPSEVFCSVRYSLELIAGGGE